MTDPAQVDAAARDELARKASDAAASIGDTTWGRNVRAAWLPDAEKAFIAACTPDVILALLAAVERGEAETKKLRRELKRVALSRAAAARAHHPTKEPADA